jgi:LysM repeat protein
MLSPAEQLPEAPKGMRRTCPFLGVLDDPETSLAFPSEMNYCHNATPPAAPKFDYQSTHCLVFAHLSCPVYKSGEKTSLPAELSLNGHGSEARISLRGNWPLKALGGVLLAALIFFIGWFGVAGLSRVGSENGAAKTQSGLPALPLFSPQPTRTIAPSRTATLAASPTSTPTPTLMAALTTPEPPGKVCGRPSNWVTYIIRAGDTLSRLSLAYGVSVAQLQNANCMGTSTVLHTGRVFYVPPGGGNPVVPTLEPTWPGLTEIPIETPTMEGIPTVPTEEPTWTTGP